ncbi:M48 family metallopeptidase [Legionella fallonii]|uniref:Putative zinc metalloprotease n=1 Tax=Legionella fallonii LLAP-10 TaxID=1212491 RepID=A0A098G7V3_9GAMM|nr:SprT family zinc-dependent metalloprotease [Legionella fallonii]CEG58091.1 putative zinc metalloprotease [Legionella fallonii LLAP-10]
MIIEIDGIAIEVVKKPIKNMNLRIYPPDGLVKLSVPMNISDRFIRQHLQEKSEWIYYQRERIRKNSSFKEELFQTGASIAFKGKNYLLIIEEHHGPCHIEIKEELLHCSISPNHSQAQIKVFIDQWYRHEMNIIVPDLIQYWQKIIGVHVAQWGIKKMKTRWGSCNTRARRIWLNLNLIKKPLVCIEYVLVHELVHLLEASHNQRFYALMTQFMPQWRDYQYLLEGKASRK